MNIHFIPKYQEKTTGIILFESDQEEQVAMSHVYVELNDLGLNFNTKDSQDSARKSPPQSLQLDEELAYKVVEELECWKDMQKEQFMAELKRREISHLAHLSNEWQRRRTEQETKLAQRLEQCGLLTKSLEEAHDAIKGRGEMGEARERYWIQVTEDMERTHEGKLNQLRDRIKSLEHEAEHKMKLEQVKHMELEMKSRLLEEENAKVKERLRELEMLVQKSLPRDQVAGLFSELVWIIDSKMLKKYCNISKTLEFLIAASLKWPFSI